MYRLLQVVAIIIVLLIVLRISLRRKGKSFNLPGRVTALNLVTGVLVGLATGLLLKGLTPGAAFDPGDPGGDVGYGVLGSALRSVLPFTGAALGLLAGSIALGTLWHRAAVRNDARARNLLFSVQIAGCALALGIILHSSL